MEAGPMANVPFWGYAQATGLAETGGVYPGLPTPMATIAAQLETYRNALAAAEAQGDGAVARKLNQQIADLEEFQKRHPEATNAPSPLEVFCDLNPSNQQCLVYDD